MKTFEEWKEELFPRIGDRLLSWSSAMEFTHCTTGGDNYWKLIKGQECDFVEPEYVELYRTTYSFYVTDIGTKVFQEEFIYVETWKKEVNKNEEDKEKSMQENDKEVTEYSRALSAWMKAQRALEVEEKRKAEEALQEYAREFLAPGFHISKDDAAVLRKIEDIFYREGLPKVKL